ncbi:uncharacterized protein TNCV_619061 [Trichonephila clavipes]|nr:uncharacterized protein TNCV_619061 [Trichonephila clavipes]
MIAITTDIESGFITKDVLVPFRCSLASFCAAPLQTEASMGGGARTANVMGAAISNVLQPGAFVWFEKTQGPLMKVLPVPCAWMTANEAVSCTRAFFTLWLSSR